MSDRSSSSYDSPSTYDGMQQQIEEQTHRELQQMRLIFLILSSILCIVFMVIAWSLFLSNGGRFPSGNMPGAARDANPFGDAMMLLTIAAFLPVLLQFVTWLLGTRIGGRQIRDRIAGRVLRTALLERMKADEEQQRKVKRAVRLTDDGELADDSIDEPLDDQLVQAEPVRRAQRNQNSPL